MADIRPFESKENKIDREIDELKKQGLEADEQIQADFNQFDLKLDNGGTITENDVRNLFGGLLKKNRVNTEVEEKLTEKGIDMSDVPSLDDVFDEAASESSEYEAWVSRKKNK